MLWSYAGLWYFDFSVKLTHIQEKLFEEFWSFLDWLCAVFNLPAMLNRAVSCSSQSATGPDPCSPLWVHLHWEFLQYYDTAASSAKECVHI